jgi:hypothetical protein
MAAQWHALSFSLRKGCVTRRERLRIPRRRLRPWTYRNWRRVVRKLPFLVDPATRTLTRFARPKDPEVRKEA